MAPSIQIRPSQLAPPPLLRLCEQGQLSWGQGRQALWGHESLVRRLGQRALLDAHTGCVNTLAWNEAGSLLVSGSDDRQVLLWDYVSCQPVRAIPTGHSNNVFGAYLLPNTNDSVLVTCAGDTEVRLHFLARDPVSTAVFTGHTGRVKRLAIEPGNPYVWFSAAEDGTVRQYDRRLQGEGTVLIEMEGAADREPRGRSIFGLSSGPEVKTLALCGAAPQYLAVGCNDPYVRVFDRRMLGAAGSSRHRDHLAQCYAPSSLARAAASPRYMGRTYVTHVAFSDDGAQLLASYGANQVYLFDVRGRQTESMLAPPPNTTQPQVPNKCAELKRQLGTSAFKKQMWAHAVHYYSEAIRLCPHASLLYSNRAAALLRRNWRGDALQAWKDAQAAITLNPDNVKGHLRLAQALYSLQRLNLAHTTIMASLERFPGESRLVEEKNIIEGLIAERRERRRRRRQRARREEENEDGVERNEGADKDKEEQENKNEVGDDSIEGHALNGSAPHIKVDRVEDEKPQPQEDDGPPTDIDSETEPLSPSESEDEEPPQRRFRLRSRPVTPMHPFSDMCMRYTGHCNTDTDIKEATFLASDWVVSGSDDGRIFVWHKASTQLVGTLQADRHVVNCVTPHPSILALASSGIESTIKLWEPMPNEEAKITTAATELVSQSTSNQQRMASDETPGATILDAIFTRVAQAQGAQQNADCVIS